MITRIVMTFKADKRPQTMCCLLMRWVKNIRVSLLNIPSIFLSFNLIISFSFFCLSVILLGESWTGKSNLFTRILKNSFSMHSYGTIAINSANKMISILSNQINTSGLISSLLRIISLLSCIRSYILWCEWKKVLLGQWNYISAVSSMFVIWLSLDRWMVPFWFTILLIENLSKLSMIGGI